MNTIKSKNPVLPIAGTSFLWSTASLMVFSVLPLFLSEVLKLSYTSVGMIEGIAIFSAFIAKFFAGILSDKIKKRVPLIIIGSTICVISKPLFAMAYSWSMIFFSRFIDRLGKGIRSAPTDALIADLAATKQLPHAYNLKQGLYSFGTVCGSLIAMIMLFFCGPNYRLIFISATIPAAIAVLVIYTKVRDCTKHKISFNNHANDFIKSLSLFPPIYWIILVMTLFLMLARFSEMFLVLRLKQYGWQLHFLPFGMLLIELLHAIFAFLNKKLLKNFDTTAVLILGISLLSFADIVFACANSKYLVIIGILLAGTHLGLTQGLLRFLIAHNSPKHLYGTAFALFYFVSGIGVFAGNYLAGKLADLYNLSYTFLAGLVATVMATAMACIIHQAGSMQKEYA